MILGISYHDDGQVFILWSVWSPVQVGSTARYPRYFSFVFVQWSKVFYVVHAYIHT